MPKDHKGNSFGSLNEMAIRYGLNPSTLRYRLREWTKRGISLACILTMPANRHSLRNYDDSNYPQLTVLDNTEPNEKKRTRCVKCYDHLGQEFDSLQEMCNHWGISYQIYSSRIRRHKWSVEKALTTPIANNKCQPIIDPNGVWWESTAKMCQAWNIDEKTFKHRINSGKYEMLDALTMPPQNGGKKKSQTA